MKRILLFLVMVLALIVLPFIAYAETTGGADFNNDLGWGNGIRDYATGHDHSYTDANTQRSKKVEAGIGVDLIVHERVEHQNNLTPLRTVVEGKWDISNKNGGVYVVATYRASEVWTGGVDLVKSIGKLIGIGRE